MKPPTLLLSMLLAAAPASVAPAASKPNIIIIVADDHRHDALGVVQREMGDKANFPFFKSPQLDRLAAGGIRFRNGFVTHSLCSPSRATLLSGLYSHQHGITFNETPYTSTNTWPHVLAANGWKTGYVGKWHMGNQRERPGFQEVATFINQGIYFDCEFVVNGKDTATTGWVDDVGTSYAIDFIRRNHDRPFALYLGFKTPHDKRTAYEESMRIPYILRHPRAFKPAVRDELVLNLDVAATILDACGLKPTWRQYGCSLVPLLAADPAHADLLAEMKARLGKLKSDVAYAAPQPRNLGQVNFTSRIRDEKPRFNYGWDWMIRLVQIGIWDGVRLEVSDGPEIESLRMFTEFDSAIGTGRLKVFAKARAGIVRRLDPGRRFVPTTPSGPAFSVDARRLGQGRHHCVHGPWDLPGDMDEWRGFWERSDAMFHAEAGVPGAAGADLIRRFCGDGGLPANETHPAWRHAAPWWLQWESYLSAGDDPASLDAYVRWSQRRQADGLSIAMAACIRRFPHCGGLIVWMGHDAFPSPCNTSILDFRGRMKPAARSLRRVLSGKSAASNHLSNIPIS